MNLDFVYKSSDHLRYENGKHVSGPHNGARRAITVQPNINGGEGYTVTLFNLDGNHPVWRNNVQMAPKQMKIVQQSSDKIVLRGYGVDSMGSSFADYGLTIYFLNGEVNKCILHMHDRNVDVEYLSENENTHKESELETICKAANAQYQNELVTNGRQLLGRIYGIVKSEPALLKDVTDYSTIGTSFLLMLDQNLTDDIDAQQFMASICYLCISKAIQKEPNNLNLYKDRLLMLQAGHEAFQYTVMNALNIGSNPFSYMASMAPLQARDAMYKMEISDLELHPELYEHIPLLKERKDEFDELIGRQFFMPEKTLDNVIKSGVQNHTTLFNYLENRVLVEEDLDF